MKTRVAILAVILTLTLVVGGVSAQEPSGQATQGNEIISIVPEQGAVPVAPVHACPFATACNWNGYAYYVRNDNAGGTGILGWHNNAAGTAPGVYGFTGSSAASANALLGVVGTSSAGANSAGVRGINYGTGGTGIGVYGSQGGSGWGVYGYTPRGLSVIGSTSSGVGVYGSSSSNIGVYGITSSGYGVVGYHVNTTGTEAGVYGLTRSTTNSANAVLGIVVPTNAGGMSAAVRGANYGTGGGGIGVYGSQNGSGWGVYGYAPNGLGVYGNSSTYAGVYGNTNSYVGVYGNANASTGWGVFGYHNNATGTAAGVYGATRSTSASASAVLGIVSPTNAGNMSAAVRGLNGGTGNLGIGVYGSQNGGGWGVYGYAPSGAGVYGNSSSGFGVYGRSNTYIGTFGGSNSSTGVYGWTGRADNNFAGLFDGNVWVVNTLFKGALAFQIDHPLDPANKYLYHSGVESPDMMNIYNGNVALDKKGEAWVELPEWFGALNSDYRYQLTAIGAPGPQLYIAEQISNNRFKIAGGKAGMTVSWQVTGIRQDPFAKANRIAVEQEKPLAERGLYLHPEAYGQAAEMGLSSLYMQGQAEGALTLEQGALGLEALSPVPLLDEQLPGFEQGAPAFEGPSSVPLLDYQVPGANQEGLELEEPIPSLPELP